MFSLLVGFGALLLAVFVSVMLDPRPSRSGAAAGRAHSDDGSAGGSTADPPGAIDHHHDAGVAVRTLPQRPTCLRLETISVVRRRIDCRSAGCPRSAAGCRPGR
jgi:hypothetical protein